MINLQNEMAVKVTKKVKYAMALYHKINVPRSTFLHGEFYAFFKKYTALILHYATTILKVFVTKYCIMFNMFNLKTSRCIFAYFKL